MPSPLPEPVLEVSEANFVAEVVEASKTALVLVDFWASWCGPCRVLGPILERLARGSGGKVRVAKVDTEREPRLAAMFQVQSIPFVVGFKGGRPVDAFVGALDEPEIRAFVGRLGVNLASPPPAAEEEERAPETPLARASEELVRRQLHDLPALRASLAAVEEDDDTHASVQRLLQAWPFFEGAIAGEGPAPQLVRQARDLWSAGREDAAMETLLEAVRADRAWAEELARKALVALMQLHAERRELVEALRRRLAVVLY